LLSSSPRNASWVVFTSYHDEASDTRDTPMINATINRKLRLFIASVSPRKIRLP